MSELRVEDVPIGARAAYTYGHYHGRAAVASGVVVAHDGTGTYGHVLLRLDGDAAGVPAASVPVYLLRDVTNP